MKKSRATKYLRRSNDRHDRWLLLAFLRESVEVLARPGDVNSKVVDVAALARRLAPSIAKRREIEKETP